MNKIVLQVEIHDDKTRKKAMKAISKIPGVESVSLDMKDLQDQKLTLTGDVDPVQVVRKLRKLCLPKILSVGPAKEPKKEDKKKVTEEKKDQSKNLAAPGIVKVCEAYHYPIMMAQPQYFYTSVEENPNACVIC